MDKIEMCYQIDEIDLTAKEFLVLTKDYRVFAFSGELGAGKTTLISSLCKALDVAETVTSPTYSIIQVYFTNDKKIIFHIDLYRMKTKEEAIDAGIEDSVLSNEICFVEWPEKAAEIFPEKTIYTNIEILSANKRKLVIHFPA